MSSTSPNSAAKVPEDFIVPQTIQEVPPEDETVGETPLVYMNLTPLIDMVFNLLFFFVMGAGGASDVFLQSKLPADKGQSKQTAVEGPKAEIEIRRLRSGLDESDCQYGIKGEGTWVSSYEQLYTKLDRIKSRMGDQVLIEIEPAANVKYVHAVNVYNQALRAGFKKIGFSEPE